MNSGTVATRYAKALLKLTTEHSTGRAVYDQVLAMLSGDIPENLHEDLSAFVALVAKNSREDLLRRILEDYISLYREQAGIVPVRLVLAEHDEVLREKLSAIFASRDKVEAVFEEIIDPDVIGGFRLEYSGLRLDATVRARLDAIAKELL